MSKTLWTLFFIFLYAVVVAGIIALIDMTIGSNQCVRTVIWFVAGFLFHRYNELCENFIKNQSEENL